MRVNRSANTGREEVASESMAERNAQRSKAD